MLNPIERCIRELLLWGYVFTNKRPFSQELLPRQQQVICIRIRKKKVRDAYYTLIVHASLLLFNVNIEL